MRTCEFAQFEMFVSLTHSLPLIHSQSTNVYQQTWDAMVAGTAVVGVCVCVCG